MTPQRPFILVSAFISHLTFFFLFWLFHSVNRTIVLHVHHTPVKKTFSVCNSLLFWNLKMDLSKYNILLKYNQNKVNTFNCIQHMFIFVCVSGGGWWLLLTFAATLTFNIFKRLFFFPKCLCFAKHYLILYIYHWNQANEYF